MESNIVSLHQFYQMLENHDWYHEMADDHGSYLTGQSALRKLKEIASQSQSHQILFDDYRRYMTIWNEGRPSKPKL